MGRKWQLVWVILLVVYVAFFGWLLAPGFLKPDKELPMLRANFFSADGDTWDIRAILDGKEKYFSVPINNLSVQLRNDGQPYTSIKLINSLHPSDWSYKAAVILAPTPDDRADWENYLKARKEAHKEYQDSKLVPRRVLPPN